METFGQKFTLIFFTALGVILGAAVIGALAAVITGQPPIKTMLKLSADLKIWAIVSAIGGTFTTLEVLELGLFHGEFLSLVKQMLYLFAAFSGAQLGHFLITSLVGGN